MNGQTTEIDVLKELMPELEAEGYEVYLHPDRLLLPKFLQGIMPDAIALRNDKKLAIEVSRRSQAKERKIKEIASLFEGQSDWEFRVVWVTPMGLETRLQSQKHSLIRTRISKVRELANEKHIQPAFLMAWATFEAIGRALTPEQFRHPQTPGRLVQVLASDGYLTPTEADSLRLLADKRNKLVHGELSTRIYKSEIDWFADVLDAMLKMAERSNETVHSK